MPTVFHLPVFWLGDCERRCASCHVVLSGFRTRLGKGVAVGVGVMVRVGVGVLVLVAVGVGVPVTVGV